MSEAGCGGAEVGLLVIHGIGNQAPTFAAPFQTTLNRRLRRQGQQERIAVEPCYWQDLVQVRQDAYRDEVRRGGLRSGLFRRLALDNLADPVMYLATPIPGQPSKYTAIQQRVLEALGRLESRVRPGAPLLILAHSFGSVVMSDYLWNQQHAARQQRPHSPHVHGHNPFTSCASLAGIVTIGCNLPLFVLGFTPYTPIALPAAQGFAPWLNLYATSDPLGWPLRPLSANMEPAAATAFLAGCEDRAVTVGPWPLRWTAYSHTAYWTAPALLRPLLERLRTLLQ